MYTLSSNIIIGAFRTNFPCEVHIKKSIHSYVDTATIKIPTSARLKIGSIVTQSVQTGKQFNEGDPVTIQLGYDGVLTTEFVGFVKRVNFSTPCEIECEGYSWQLGNKQINKSWKNSVSINDILVYILQDTGISIHPSSPKISTLLSGFTLHNATGKNVLEQIKKQTGLAIYFIGSALYVGTLYTVGNTNNAQYRLGYNTIKDNELKYRTPEATKIRLKVNYKDAKGKTQFKIFGDTSDQAKEVSINKGTFTDMKLLQEQAMAEASKYRYPGYEGHITTFLLPYAEPGWEAVIKDDKYPERGGSYVLESVETTFGNNGARRKVGLGYNINVNV